MRRFAVLPILVGLVMGACSSPTATVAAPATTVADRDAVEGASWAIQITKTHATIAVVDADGGSATHPSFDAAGATVVFVSDGVLKRLDLASGETTPAFTRSVKGEHPRPRPA